MQVREILDKKTWKTFLLSQSNTLFVQAPEYGEFYENTGEHSWVFGVYDGETLLGGSLVVSTHAKRGNFLYLPYGPVFDDKRVGEGDMQKQAYALLFQHLRAFAKKEGYAFIKASPFINETEEHAALFAENGFRPAPLHVLAETTWLLDLSPDEETLLMNMNKNHRNLIRRCKREGVRIEIKRDEAALAELNDMLDVVAERHNFHRFSRTYINNEFHVFEKANEAVIFEAYLPDGRMDASAIIMFFGTMANYRHSASLNLNKRLPTSYLIQWEVIKEAKRRGCEQYNFWGIAPENAKKDHPFYGITHFKKGFGGRQKDLLPCQDMPLSIRYWFNWMIESIRKRKRKF